MLYLEDYLEMIKDLPQELRDRFTEMRELDLQVHNSTDRLEEKVKMLFSNAKKMKMSERDDEYENIRKEYYKTLEDGDEKVQLANQIYDLVDRHLRRLDQELHKFKMELEADNAGITEILERRSLELDQPNGPESQKENRYSGITSRPLQERNQTLPAASTPASSVKKEERSGGEGRTPSTTPPLPANLAYSLGHIGAGSNAIAAAASQAIAATQQMQQGRRTASMKASYDAVSAGVHTQEFSIGKELAGAAQTAVAATGMSQGTEKKQKKKSSSAMTTPIATPIPMALDASPTPSEELVGDNIIDPNGDNPDWAYDPNEPRYCICNQVSYGDMVACDNPTCPLEWFHYPCVGITAPPRGKWFCPQCAAAMKRRARK